MDAVDNLKAGNLVECQAELIEKVKKDPSNKMHRIFLFQLSAVLGNWDRALNQLGVLGEMDAGTLPMVQTYREALQCEVLRAEIFAGKRSPLVFGEPPEWIARMIEALRLSAQGHHAEAQEARAAALELAEVVGGNLVLREERREPFEWLADADSRLGPIMEVILSGRYYWVPVERIHKLAIEEPADLRDVVWMPAHFQWTNGGETVGLIPTRYPGSELQEDGMLRLARHTVWEEQGEGVYTGFGQRMLATDAGEYPLMDVRGIELDTPLEDASPEDAGADA